MCKNNADARRWSKPICVSSGTSRNCLSEKSVWLVILLTAVVCLVPGLAVSFVRVDLFPTLTDKVHEQTQCLCKINPKMFVPTFVHFTNLLSSTTFVWQTYLLLCKFVILEKSKSEKGKRWIQSSRHIFLVSPGKNWIKLLINTDWSTDPQQLFVPPLCLLGSSGTTLQKEWRPSAAEPEASTQDELPPLCVCLLPPEGLRRADYLREEHEELSVVATQLQLDRKCAEGKEWSVLRLWWRQQKQNRQQSNRMETDLVLWLMCLCVRGTTSFFIESWRLLDVKRQLKHDCGRFS